MKVEIKLDEKKQPFFIERRRITSARIVRSGFQDYGVVFTGIGKPNELDEEPPPDLKASDSDFDIDLLPGALVGWRSATDEEDQKFFDILGGYFYNQGGSNDGTTTKVFGIAKENAFEITEGGKTTVNDRWELAEPASRGLDEKEGEGGGWTFIVRWKDDGDFPHSSTQLKISVECPEIQSATAVFGDCELDAKTNTLKRKVTLKAATSGAEPKSWTWHFGDGQSKSGDGKPPESIDYLYGKKPANAPKLTVVGSHAVCRETSKEVDFSDFEACPPCPEVKNVATRVTKTEPQTIIVEFKVETEAGTANTYEWDWGDGSPKEKTTTPVATHTYKRLEKDDVSYTVKVTLMGPQECRAQGQTTVNVPKMPVTPVPEPVPEPPKVGPCLWLQLLVAFLLAITGGILIVCIALASFYPDVDNTNEIIAIAIFAILSIVCIIFWFSMVRKGKCARPGHCEWKAIAWVVLLAAALVALYIARCCPAAWWILILILLIVAAILLYLWLKKCSSTTKTMLLHIVVALIAALIVSIFFTRNLLEACANASM